MAKRVFQFVTYTPTATTDNTTLTNGQAQVIEAGSATAYVEVMEVYIGGQAGASTPTLMQFARNVAATTTPTLSAGASDGPMRNYTAVLAATTVVATSGTTLPARSTSQLVSRLNLSINAFGGIVRWVAAPGEEWGILGTSTNASGSSLSAYTGGTPGLLGSHCVYEPFIWLLTAISGTWLASALLTLDASSLVA